MNTVRIYLYVYTDLLPGRVYTVAVSSENAITDQVPADQFSTIAASMTFILNTLVEASTTETTMIEEANLVVTITVPTTILLVLIAITALTIVITVIKKRRKTQEVEEDYYCNSERGSPPRLDRMQAENSSYQPGVRFCSIMNAALRENEENKMQVTNQATSTKENPADGVFNKKQATTTADKTAYWANVTAISHDYETRI